MAGNRKNSVDDLAAGFLSTRPAAFDKFLHQPTITLPTETHVGDQRANNDEQKAEPINHPTERPRVENEKKGKEDPIEQSLVSQSTDMVKPLHRNQTESTPNLKQTASTTGKSKKLIGPYEVLFLAKSDQHSFDPGDQRVYLKRTHAKILNRMVLYCEQKNCRINLQAILDNILHHHFEQYASDIKQIDLHLLNLLTQQIND